MLADNKVLNFVDSLFNEARLNDELPAVRTPQEGYGIMAERFLSVASSTAGAKKAVADAERRDAAVHVRGTERRRHPAGIPCKQRQRRTR